MKRKSIAQKIGFAALGACMGANILFLGTILFFIGVKGLGAINWAFLTQAPRDSMTAAIAAEMGEAPVGSDHYDALFAIALILFLITFAFNIAAELISRRFRLKLGLAR